MNRGIEMLIARMQSNPEEFAPDDYVREGGLRNKWENLVSNWRHCLTEEELKAFQDALKEAHRELFSQRVMKHILTAGEVHDVVETPRQMPYQHPYNTPIVTLQPNTASAFTANSLHVGSETLDEEMVRLMKEQLKQYKATGKI
jgi:hypothetical protein